ncbi:hypothetical protein BaRGS_00010137, partial [Batillaria attramentaria]
IASRLKTDVTTVICTSLIGVFNSRRLDHQQLVERARKVAAAHRMANNLQLLPGVNKRHTPVFVVEEHFEVLKHWFDAVKVGVIPQTGNTLLHIDGHSDGGIPFDLSIVPQFRPPKDHHEVVSMMQSNDVFIAAAALAGLIQRFIWVWPAWDIKDHRNESDHEAFDVQVGWRTFYPLKGEPVRRLCACSRPQLQNTNLGSRLAEWECWDHEGENTEPHEGPVISSLNCTLEMTGSVEFVSERKALELLQAGGWITEKDRLMLDVDEDYYGCESSVMPLYQAGLPQSTIDNISELLGQLLCVETVKQEYLADSFFHAVIHTVLNLKMNDCKSGHGHGPCLTNFDVDKALINKIPWFVSSLLAGTFEDLPCSREENSNNILMQAVLRILEDLKVSQLQALDYVGVCLRTAPTNFFFEENSLHVCHGPNTPNQTEVTFHVPEEAENKERTELLKKLLSLLPSHPSVVTVCRSVRDGYTPWRHFGFVENAIFSALKDAFSDVKEESFHFDENLLGGKKGWPDRHK